MPADNIADKRYMAPIGLGNVKLKSLQKEGWPELKRGMAATVHRPFRLRDLFKPTRLIWAFLAWRIREHTSRITGGVASEHHAMLYAGNGKCWSQDMEFDLVPLSNYAGCRVTFFNPPLTLEERNQIMGACAPYQGRKYGWRDILGYLAWSLTGNPKLFKPISDHSGWHCSEAVCRLMRGAIPGAFGKASCEMQHPQALYDWASDHGWPRIEMWIKG